MLRPWSRSQWKPLRPAIMNTGASYFRDVISRGPGAAVDRRRMRMFLRWGEREWVDG